MISTVQQAISALLNTYEPQFLNFGLNLFRAFATILIAWHGLKMMFSQETVNTTEQMFSFAKLVLFIAFGYAMIAFYEPAPSSPRLEWQTESFARRTGLRCRFAGTADVAELDIGRATAVFRMFQEMLTNVERHSQANHVSVVVQRVVDRLVLQVRDNGRGVAPKKALAPSSFGLLGMRERVCAWSRSCCPTDRSWPLR